MERSPSCGSVSSTRVSWACHSSARATRHAQPLERRAPRAQDDLHQRRVSPSPRAAAVIDELVIGSRVDDLLTDLTGHRLVFVMLTPRLEVVRRREAKRGTRLWKHGNGSTTRSRHGHGVWDSGWTTRIRRQPKPLASSAGGAGQGGWSRHVERCSCTISTRRLTATRVVRLTTTEFQLLVSVGGYCCSGVGWAQAGCQMRPCEAAAARVPKQLPGGCISASGQASPTPRSGFP